MNTLSLLPLGDWTSSQEPTKMMVVGNGLTGPSRLWSALMDEKTPASMVLFLRLLDGVEASNRQLMEKLDLVQARCSSLEGQVLLANSNFERTKDIPQRLQRVERFVWAATGIAAFMGVLIGGVGQRMISDALTKPETTRHEERFSDRRPPHSPTAVTSP